MFGFWKRKRERPAETPLPTGVLACVHWERRGDTIGFGEYRIASFDEGATWWNIGHGGATVTPADPALLRHLAGLDAVRRLAKEQPWLNRLSAPDDREVYGAAGVAPRRAD